MEWLTGPWYIYRNFSEQLSGNVLAVMRVGAMQTLVKGEKQAGAEQCQAQ